MSNHTFILQLEWERPVPRRNMGPVSYVQLYICWMLHENNSTHIFLKLSIFCIWIMHAFTVTCETDFYAQGTFDFLKYVHWVSLMTFNISTTECLIKPPHLSRHWHLLSFVKWMCFGSFHQTNVHVYIQAVCMFTVMWSGLLFPMLMLISTGEVYVVSCLELPWLLLLVT